MVSVGKIYGTLIPNWAEGGLLSETATFLVEVASGEEFSMRSDVFSLNRVNLMSRADLLNIVLAST